MEDSFENNLRTLKELILDEGKIVTYVSLSKELCIHVNEAKKLLNHVVKDIRKTEPNIEIYVCYMISGLLDDSSACTTVCSEFDLDMFKKKLRTIFFEHVYCVSKGMQAVDNLALTAVHTFEDLTLCSGLIKANSCSKRAEKEIQSLKSNVIQNAIDSKSKVISKNTTEKKREFFKSDSDSCKKPVEVKSETVPKPKTPSPKKESQNSKVSNKNGMKSASRSIAGFFNKSNGDTHKERPAKIKEEKEETHKVAVKVEKEIKIEEHKTVKNTAVKKEKEESLEKEKTSNKSLNQIKKKAKVDKKRKRLLHVSDSESDNETNDPFADDKDDKMAVDQESEDEIPPTPSINTVKITSGIINPKKRRKIVDKTYTDEDGYILTKKEEIYESCSDHEEEVKTNIKQEKENVEVTQVKTETSPIKGGKIKKKKVSPPQKGKQQTLTNFFKKV